MAQYLTRRESAAGTIDLGASRGYIQHEFGKYETGNTSIHFLLATEGDQNIPANYSLVDLEQCATNGQEDGKMTGAEEGQISFEDLRGVLDDIRHQYGDVEMGGT
jgi:hypothetical protein